MEVPAAAAAAAAKMRTASCSPRGVLLQQLQQRNCKRYGHLNAAETFPTPCKSARCLAWRAVLLAVLLDSKERFAGDEDGMAILDSWSEDNDMCSFYGIVCNANGLVIAM
jgi:hypothetical protein